MPTKDKLADALAICLENKSLKEITIKEVVEIAGVIRQTFYYHFDNIYDLAQYLLYRELNKMLVKEPEKNLSLERIYHSFLANKTAILNMRKGKEQTWFTEELINFSRPVIQDIIEKKSSNYLLTAEDLKFITGFYTYGFIGIFTLWLDKEMPEEYQNNFAKADRLLGDCVDYQLQALSKDN